MITERELNIEEAYNRLTRLHHHLGLQSKTELLKKSSLVATCHLYDSTYKEVSCGAGKGEHCELGALAESLEHYFVDKSTPPLIESDQILQSIAPFDDWLLKSIPPYAAPAFHPPHTVLSVRGQVKRTLINLEKHNKIAFYRTLYEHPNLATVVQVFIPGLERFHLIRSGIPIAPQSALKGIRQ